MATTTTAYILTLLLVVAVVSATCSSSELYSFTVEDIRGSPVPMAQFRGKVLLLVNVASQCGLTDTHYKALKRLHDILSPSGRFSVLAFPCNDFGKQEPWDEKEIEEFVRGNFHADFPLFKKVKVVAGQGQSKLWKHVIKVSGVNPSWNFQK